jgi:hypothetical protein
MRGPRALRSQRIHPQRRSADTNRTHAKAVPIRWRKQHSEPSKFSNNSLRGASGWGSKLICQGPNIGRVSISRGGFLVVGRGGGCRVSRRFSRLMLPSLTLMPSAIPSSVPRSTGVEPRATSQKYKSPQRLDQGVGVFFDSARGGCE